MFLFFNSSTIFFIINIYSDKHQYALKYLRNTEADIQNVLAMAGDFNIRDRDYDSSYFFYLSHSDSLMEVADSFNLKLFSPIH